MTLTAWASVASTACLVGTAHGAWVGGAFVTSNEWNAAASAATGETATVFRLYMAFDAVGDGMNGVGNTFLDTVDGSLLYQDEFAGDAPPTGDIGLRPALEWDSYVSGGNLRGPSLTVTDPSFNFSPTGLNDPNFGFGSGWLAIGGWTQPTPENIALAPGDLDQNSNAVIPSDFDSQYLYSFQAQFTVLGIDVQQANLIFDGGFIHTDYFDGIMDLSWSRDEDPSGFLTFERDLLIGVPAPSALGWLVAANALRRRRSPNG